MSTNYHHLWERVVKNFSSPSQRCWKQSQLILIITLKNWLTISSTVYTHGKYNFCDHILKNNWIVFLKSFFKEYAPHSIANYTPLSTKNDLSLFLKSIKNTHTKVSPSLMQNWKLKGIKWSSLSIIIWNNRLIRCSDNSARYYGDTDIFLSLWKCSIFHFK